MRAWPVLLTFCIGPFLACDRQFSGLDRPEEAQNTFKPA